MHRGEIYHHEHLKHRRVDMINHCSLVDIRQSMQERKGGRSWDCQMSDNIACVDSESWVAQRMNFATFSYAGRYIAADSPTKIPEKITAREIEQEETGIP